MSLRVGLIGMGMMGQMHASIIQEFYPQVTIAAVCDPDAENLGKAKALVPGASAMEDPDALIGAEVDAVVLSTPGFTHADLAERCVAAGKHVFAEKPVMTTREGCERMVKLANAHGDLSIVINHELRYSIFYAKVKQLIAAGEIGRPRLAWCKAMRGPFVKKVGNWIQDRRCSGGAMVDVSSHHYDLLNWYVGGKPKRVSAFGGNALGRVLNNEHEVNDHASVSFEYDNGVRGSLSLCMFAPPGGDQLELGVAGDGGILQTRPGSGDIVIWKRGGERKEPVVHHVESSSSGRGTQFGWVESHDGFFEAIQTGRRALTDVRECVDGTLLAIAAEEAIAKRTVVDV